MNVSELFRIFLKKLFLKMYKISRGGISEELGQYPFNDQFKKFIE